MGVFEELPISFKYSEMFKYFWNTSEKFRIPISGNLSNHFKNGLLFDWGISITFYAFRIPSIGKEEQISQFFLLGPRSIVGFLKGLRACIRQKKLL